MTTSYATVTELPGSGVTPEQLSMLYTRYHLAADFGAGKDVLEVACGPGVGLSYLVRRTRSVIGGDFDRDILRLTPQTAGVRLLQLDAQALPFDKQSFDLVILFEALYYLAIPEKFVAEARRVLRPGGRVLLCTANKDAPGFNPSPYTYRYFSVPQLQALLQAGGFLPEVYGAFPVKVTTFRDRALLPARRAVVGLHLVPTTMRGKELVKRILYRTVVPLPNALHDGMAELHPLEQLPGDVPTTKFKVLYTVGRLP